MDTYQDIMAASLVDVRRLAGRFRNDPDGLMQRAIKNFDLSRKHAANAMTSYVEAGRSLLALQQNLPRDGEYSRMLERYGWSQPTAWRMTEIARFYHCLPDLTPEGEPWTQTAALEWWKEKKQEHHVDSIVSIERPDELMGAVAIAASAKKPRKKKAMGPAERLRQKAYRLRNELEAAFSEPGVSGVVKELYAGLGALIEDGEPLE